MSAHMQKEMQAFKFALACLIQIGVPTTAGNNNLNEILPGGSTAQLWHQRYRQWDNGLRLQRSANFLDRQLETRQLEKTPRGLKKNPVDNLCILMPQYRSVSAFSSASVCSVSAALARKSRLFRTSVVCEGHSASSQLQLESRNFSVQV